MEKITLKLYEFYNLDAELNGVKDPATGKIEMKGILSEKIPLVTKYWFSDLARKVGIEKDALEKQKEDLIKQYGVADKEGNVTIANYIDNPNKKSAEKKIINPALLSFQKEFNELLEQEKEFEYRPIKLSDMAGIESETNFTALFKLVKVEDE